MLRADLHIHTCYSMDCNTPLDRIVARCIKVGINCLVSMPGIPQGVAEVVIRQLALRIEFDGLFHVPKGLFVVLPLMIQVANVDIGIRGRGG